MARCAERPTIVAGKENISGVTLCKAVRDAVDPANMTVLCGLGGLQFAYEAAPGHPGFVSWTANVAPDLPLELVDAADAADFGKVRAVIAKTGPPYESCGTLARNRGRDSWVLPGFTSGHIYVGALKAPLDLVGLAGGPVRGPGGGLAPPEREQLASIPAPAYTSPSFPPA